MGVLIFPQKGPWKNLNPCNWVFGRATQGCRSVAIRFWRGGSLAARGKWGKRFRGSRWSRGWPVLGKRGTEAAYRRRTGADGGAPSDDGGVLVAGGQESGGEVARKLPRDDVVLMVCLTGAERQWIVGTTVRLSGGGAPSSPVQWSDRSSAGE
jgi:hypothetical protein